MKKLLLALFLLALPAYSQSPSCTNLTFSATGRQLFAVGGGTDLSRFSGANFTYRTTGTPATLSITIEGANVLAATETPITKVAASTTTTGQVDLGKANGPFRFWYANLATLTGGTSPTVIVTGCFQPNALISLTGSSGVVTGSGTSGQPAVWNGANSIAASPAVRYADQYAGATAGAKIIAAIADLPAGGGTVTGCGLAGAQTISSAISLTNNVTLRLCNGSIYTFSGSGQITLSAGSALLCDVFGIPSTPNLGCLFVNNTTSLTPVVVANGAIGAVIENIGFDGNSRTNSLGSAIQFASGAGTTNRIYLRNISIVNWKGYGIELNDTQDSHFDNITMSGVGNATGSKGAISLATDSNSNHFAQLQIDGPYFAGVFENSTAGGNMFSNLKIDLGSSPAGTINFYIHNVAPRGVISNFQFRGDTTTADTIGDGILSDVNSPDWVITNGYLWRSEAKGAVTPTAIHLNNASISGWRVSNVVIDGWHNGVRDVGVAGSNMFSGITYRNNTLEAYTDSNYAAIITPNCADSAGAAACGADPAGHFVIDAAATSVVVNTTAVTASSEIPLTFDSSLGTLLGVTCNTLFAAPYISARTAGVSFTVSIPVAPITNPACFGYGPIVN